MVADCLFCLSNGQMSAIGRNARKIGVRGPLGPGSVIHRGGSLNAGGLHAEVDNAGRDARAAHRDDRGLCIVENVDARSAKHGLNGLGFFVCSLGCQKVLEEDVGGTGDVSTAESGSGLGLFV